MIRSFRQRNAVRVGQLVVARPHPIATSDSHSDQRIIDLKALNSMVVQISDVQMSVLVIVEETERDDPIARLEFPALPVPATIVTFVVLIRHWMTHAMPWSLIYMFEDPSSQRPPIEVSTSDVLMDEPFPKIETPLAAFFGQSITR